MKLKIFFIPFPKLNDEEFKKYIDTILFEEMKIKNPKFQKAE